MEAKGASEENTMGSQETVDIITLDNFAELLPKWDPSAKDHLYALVDMGRLVAPVSSSSRRRGGHAL